MPFIRTFCRECYSEPEAVYEKLKRSGMDLVTVTDHDSIEVLGDLGHHPDFFLSEEVTCRMPSGTEAHLGVYDITERQHIEIQRRCNDMPSLLAYLGEQDIVYSLNHPFSSLTGRRVAGDFTWFEAFFPVLEVCNGHLLARNNSLARELVRRGGKAGFAGSDAHTLFSLGAAFTEVPEARSRLEFLEGLKRNRAKVNGSAGNYWRLTRDLLWIGMETMWEAPATVLFSPLLLAIPLAALCNCLMEIKFARQWGQNLFDRNDKWEGSISRSLTPIDSEEAQI